MKCNTITISELKTRFHNGQLQLEPPYQRRSVWKTRQRNLLLESIFNGIPIPALIFHKHFDEKRKINIYDVLDGKQRIETILHFIESHEIENEKTLSVKIKDNTGKNLTITYQDLKSKRFSQEHNNVANKFWDYPLPFIEYEGEVTNLFDNSVPTMEIFVRINSTGSPLKKNEIRHASNSGIFFELGEELERKFKTRFVDDWKIFSQNDIERYLLHEFILELCTAIHFDKYTDRRVRLDDLLRNHTWENKESRVIKKRFSEIIMWMKSIFTDQIFIHTRFKNKSDFYSLFVVLNELIGKSYSTKNNKNNKVLGNAFVDFSKAIQTIAPRLKKWDLKSNKNFTASDKELFPYVIATRDATDSLLNRRIRNDYLMKFIKGGFILNVNDKNRRFDENVKGMLWLNLLQKTKTPKCANPNNNPSCKKILTYENAQVDHLFPWVRGGKTTLQNARLICDSCNKSKGAKIE